MRTNKRAIAACASEDEIREAVAFANQTRQWRTIFYSMGYDFEAFKEDFDKKQAK